MRLLVIEDDSDMRSLLVSALEGANFAVDAATDGEQGSYVARTNDYDAIILDYSLPKKDGLTVCREIRRSGRTMPIIMLTVHSEIDNKIKMFEEGVDDYLTKPFSLEELIARIRALLRRPKELEPMTVTLGDLEVDMLGQRVLRRKEEIYLTRKEFAVLEYLVRNRGMTVSRGMLMEHVWNMDRNPFSNTIEAHILNLRKKLSRGDHTLIATVPGRGYRVENR